MKQNSVINHQNGHDLPKQRADLFQKQGSSLAPTGATPLPLGGTMYLQRSLGNRSIQRLLETKALQAKLKINQPNDIYEQEADRVASQVMQKPVTRDSSANGLQSLVQRQSLCPECEEEEERVQTKPLAKQITPLVQRQSVCPECEEEEEPIQTKRVQGKDVGNDLAPPIVYDVLHSQGQPLDPGTRDFMESRFGHDFRGVRVHAGPQASASARAVQSIAYTVGHDIVFGAGQFAPRTGYGRHLLSHELVHVIQQTDGATRQINTPVKPADDAAQTGTHENRGNSNRTNSLCPASTAQMPVHHHSTSPRVSRQNTQQTSSVLSQGAVASVQFILDGTINSTRVGPVIQREDVSVIIGRLTTIRRLAQVLLPLWNTATPFTPQGSTTPVAFTPLTIDELAKGLLVFNRYRLAIPPAANPPVMTYWKIGMRFPLPIRIDTRTNEGILHPDPIRLMAGTFDPTWTSLLDKLPEVLPALPAANLQQSVTSFMTNNPTTLSRGYQLAGQAVVNAQDSKEFILEVFNQVGAGAFELALAFMEPLVNRDIAILAPQTAGAAILARISSLLASPPATITAAQQSDLTRANGMLGRVATIQAQPDPCIPNRKLTWDDFTGAVPGNAPATRGAWTAFNINEVPFQGNRLFQATFNGGGSWGRPKYRQPNDPALNGCTPLINNCQQHFNNLPPGTVGANWNFIAGPAAGCPATILPNPAVTAHSHGDCAALLGPECNRAAGLESQRLLRHEQAHFDIPCVLVHIANRARAGGTNVTLATVRSRANALTTQYDSTSQTNNGCNATSQANWENDIANGMPAQTFP